MDEIVESSKKELYLATVASIGENGLTLIIDGSEEASTKEYKANIAERYAEGDRVIICKISGTYVVLCAIGVPASRYPIPSGGLNTYVLKKHSAADYDVYWDRDRT